jgi:hypothetical protein
VRLFHRPEKAPPEAVARLDPDELVALEQFSRGLREQALGAQ